MNKVIVLGSKGQIGSALAKYLATQLKTAVQLFTPRRDELDVLDVAACRQYFERLKPNLVYYLIGYTNVDRAFDQQDLCLGANYTGVCNTLDAIVCSGCDAGLIYLSTDFVFHDLNLANYFDENSKPCPHGFYGQTKFLGENVVLSYSKGVVVRAGWILSESEKSLVRKVLARAKENLAVGVRELSVPQGVGSPVFLSTLISLIAKYSDERSITSTDKIVHVSESVGVFRDQLFQKIVDLGGYADLQITALNWESNMGRPFNSSLSRHLAVTSNSYPQAFVDRLGITVLRCLEKMGDTY